MFQEGAPSSKCISDGGFAALSISPAARHKEL
jgi:hypothetical protein